MAIFCGKTRAHMSATTVSESPDKNDDFSATNHQIMMYSMSIKINRCQPSYTKDFMIISSFVFKWQDIKIGSPTKKQQVPVM